MRVVLGKHFKKQIAKLDNKIYSKLEIRLSLFTTDPFNKILRNHALIGEFSGYRSINITGDWRAIYLVKHRDEAEFVLLGTHSQLYK